MLDAIDEGYSLILFPKVQEGSPNKWENKVRHSPYLVSATGTEIYTGFHDRHGTFTPQRRINLIALQGIHLYGTPAVAGSTDVHEILKQITDDFEMMKDKYQVVTEDDE